MNLKSVSFIHPLFNIRKYYSNKITLLCLIVGAVKLQILGENPSSTFNCYNRMT